jgi:hypothetical protein
LRYYLKQELPDLQKNDIRLQAIGRLAGKCIQSGITGSCDMGSAGDD